MTARRRRLSFLLTCVAIHFMCAAAANSQSVDSSPDEKRLVGPVTENRFPPLVVPDGFHATLFACDPLVEYASVMTVGPESGSLFVAHDYMTGLGTEITRRDEVRILRDTDGDGYADRSTIYADGFNSIQGLAYSAGCVYVMHSPRLTRLEDTDGDRIADRRQDLIEGLGLPPEENPNRLHCANGVVAAHDGWLYLAIGDRGCDVTRPEGDRLLVQEGGILRCRPDGRDLHVFSHGLRNIYDVTLDEDLNVFVRDNENDGGDYMVRVCHSFHGSDHGYPYLYYERPDEAMPPLADLGRGSSAGGVAYLETAFPPEYRGSLFFCEWGRAVVRYHPTRAGAGFAPVEEHDFAAGAADDPYGFKPTDVVVDRDGSLLIADWGDGQRPKRGRARIYRIAYAGGKSARTVVDRRAANFDIAALLDQLNSESYATRVDAQEKIEQLGQSGIESVERAIATKELNPRGRLHGVWILAHSDVDVVSKLLAIAVNEDDDARVRAQAFRAIADLTDPILVAHRLDVGRGDKRVCGLLAAFADGEDARMRLEALIALGRLRWSEAPHWLATQPAPTDAALAHATMVLLRRADNWPAVLQLLDASPEEDPSMPSLRTLALRALAEVADEAVVDGLMARLHDETTAERQREYLDLLARVHRKPAEWAYWGFRPGPRPADSVAWEATSRIGTALNSAIRDAHDSAVRAFAARRMLREEVPIELETLRQWQAHETEADAVAAIVEALTRQPPEHARDLLASIVSAPSHQNENRLAALTTFVEGLDAKTEGRLLDLAVALDEGPVLAAVLREAAKRPSLEVAPLLLAKLDSMDSDVRAAAAESLAIRSDAAVAPRVAALLVDNDVRVRRAAAMLAGKLRVATAANALLDDAGDADPRLRVAALVALEQLGDARAVPLALEALAAPECQCAALAYLARFGNARHRETVTTIAVRSRSIEVLAAAVTTLATWQGRAELHSSDWKNLEQAIARLQAVSGVPLHWRLAGPISAGEFRQVLDRVSAAGPFEIGWLDLQTMALSNIDGAEARVVLPPNNDEATSSFWLVATTLLTNQFGDVEFSASATGGLTVWMNGREIHRRQEAPNSRAESFRFDASLDEGENRLLACVPATRVAPTLQLRFRRKSSKAEHEKLTLAALTGRGNADRGRELFLNAEKSQCVRCHRLGEEGGRIGPDLAGIGGRFSRIHLVESILEPSRTVAPSYETRTVALASGLVLSGVTVSEDDTRLTLADNEAKIHEIAKSEIDEMQTQPQSTMPEGLEKRLTERQFIDLIEFLSSLRSSALP